MIVCVLWLLLSSAAVVQHPTEDVQAKASAPWQKCLQVHAAQLDDGHTDLASLGKILTVVCKSEFEQMIVARGKNLSPDDQKKLRASLESQYAGAGNVAIMRHRL